VIKRGKQKQYFFFFPKKQPENFETISNHIESTRKDLITLKKIHLVIRCLKKIEYE